MAKDMTPGELAEKWVGHDFHDGLNEEFLSDLTPVIRGKLIELPHYFNAPDEDKSSRFCRCGKYLTDEVHLRKL